MITVIIRNQLSSSSESKHLLVVLTLPGGIKLTSGYLIS
jgi:hypothetical protein